MAITKEMIDKIAKEIAEAIVGKLPAAFLVYEPDMKELMRCVMMLEKHKPLDDKQHQHIIDVLKLVWDHCKMMSHDDMDTLARGLELAEAEQEAKEVKDKN